MAEQLLIPGPEDERVQGLPLKVPVLSVEKLTLPVGEDGPPDEAVSVTIAVQVVVWPCGSEAGLQLADVLVERVTLITKGEAALSLPLWTVLPA